MNTFKLKSLAFVLAAMSAVLSTSASQTNVIAYTWAQIDSAAAAYTDIVETGVGAQNYVKVKARTAVSSTTSKSYVAFDLAGKSANSNLNATLSLKRNGSSGQQHIQLWVLNQAFPAMNTNLCWGSDTNLIPVGLIGSQANDTNSNDMLTTGAFTATAFANDVVNGGNITDNYVLAAPWGQYVFNGKIIFAITGIPDTNSPSGSAGYRVVLTNAPSTNVPPTVDLPSFKFTDTLGNQPPSITTAGGVTMYSHTTTNIAFTVNDDSTSAASLYLIATSADSTVVATNFAYTGQGVSGARSVTLLAGLAGTTTVTVKVDDGVATNFTQFTVTVLPNPAITTPTWTNTIGTNAVTSALTVSDALFPVSSITNDATSQNPSLISSSNVVFSGASSNRTVTVTANAGQDGVCIIKLIAGDTNGTTSVEYPVMVLPSTNIYFSDHFTYAAGSMDSHSAFLWSERSFGSTSLRVQDNAALIRASTSGQDLIAPLVRGPYTSGVIWVGFNATWTNMPTAANGWFLHLYDAVDTNAIARVYSMTNGVSTNTFTIGVANVAGAQPLTNELSLNVTYKVVMAFDINGSGALFPLLAGSPISQLWLNPIDTNSPSVLAADQTGVTAGAPITHIGLRQDTGMGIIAIDDLKVGASFAEVLPPTLVVLTQPVITGSAHISTNLTIYFNGSTNDLATDFGVVRSSIVNGSYTTAVTNASILTLSSGNFQADVPLTATNQANFYKIKR